MSRKNVRKLSISTLSARKSKRAIRQTPQSREESTSTILPNPQVVVLQRSRSQHDPSRTLHWDNDVKFQIARNILHLRRARGWSQGRVAQAMGTSQPALARIERADENITVNTLQRLITALKGRLRLAIYPAELHVPEVPQFWWA